MLKLACCADCVSVGCGVQCQLTSPWQLTSALQHGGRTLFKSTSAQTKLPMPALQKLNCIVELGRRTCAGFSCT